MSIPGVISALIHSSRQGMPADAHDAAEKSAPLDEHRTKSKDHKKHVKQATKAGLTPNHVLKAVTQPMPKKTDRHLASAAVNKGVGLAGNPSGMKPLIGNQLPQNPPNTQAALPGSSSIPGGFVAPGIASQVPQSPQTDNPAGEGPDLSQTANWVNSMEHDDPHNPGVRVESPLVDGEESPVGTGPQSAADLNRKKSTESMMRAIELLRQRSAVKEPDQQHAKSTGAALLMSLALGALDPTHQAGAGFYWGARDAKEQQLTQDYTKAKQQTDTLKANLADMAKGEMAGSGNYEKLAKQLDDAKAKEETIRKDLTVAKWNNTTRVNRENGLESDKQMTNAKKAYDSAITHAGMSLPSGKPQAMAEILGALKMRHDVGDQSLKTQDGRFPDDEDLPKMAEATYDGLAKPGQNQLNQEGAKARLTGTDLRNEMLRIKKDEFVKLAPERQAEAIAKSEHAVSMQRMDKDKAALLGLQVTLFRKTLNDKVDQIKQAVQGIKMLNEARRFGNDTMIGKEMDRQRNELYAKANSGANSAATHAMELERLLSSERNKWKGINFDVPAPAGWAEKDASSDDQAALAAYRYYHSLQDKLKGYQDQENGFKETAKNIFDDQTGNPATAGDAAKGNVPVHPGTNPGDVFPMPPGPIGK